MHKSNLFRKLQLAIDIKCIFVILQIALASKKHYKTFYMNKRPQKVYI